MGPSQRVNKNTAVRPGDRYMEEKQTEWKLKISNAADNADITQSQYVTLGIVECRK